MSYLKPALLVSVVILMGACGQNRNNNLNNNAQFQRQRLLNQQINGFNGVNGFNGFNNFNAFGGLQQPGLCNQFQPFGNHFQGPMGQRVFCINQTNFCGNFMYNINGGFHVGPNGQAIQCAAQGIFNYQTVFPYWTTMGQGCTVWTNGTFYPMWFGNTLACVNITLLGGSIAGHPFYNQRPLHACYFNHDRPRYKVLEDDDDSDDDEEFEEDFDDEHCDCKQNFKSFLGGAIRTNWGYCGW